MFLANSLIDGFFVSNFIGRGIVIMQILASVFMVAVAIGKWRELRYTMTEARRFLRDFVSSHDVLEYYAQRRPAVVTGIEGIYRETCERLLKALSPDVRTMVVGRQPGTLGAALTKHEVELIRGTCEHELDQEQIRVMSGMSVIAAVVTLSPMLGLLGTVWGVLDAFAEMGSAGSANLATIAPSISSALVTTVVGLLVAIPGTIVYAGIQAMAQQVVSNNEGFVDELMGRIACEFQGKDD